jgi:hypothetical protein
MGVAVAKGEIWVANFGDHTALVFPRLAAGNVAPRRILRNETVGLFASQAAVGQQNDVVVDVVTKPPAHQTQPVLAIALVDVAELFDAVSAASIVGIALENS